MTMPKMMLKGIGLAALAVGAIVADRHFDFALKVQTLAGSLLPGAKATANTDKPAAAPLRSVRVIEPKAAAGRFGLTLPGEQCQLSRPDFPAGPTES